MRILTPFSLATIRQFVLREGDQQTYCNRFNDNPHLELAGFDIFLNPADGRNINCDPGEFDELVFRQGSNYTSVSLVDESLKFESKDQSSLERYFATTIAYISNQD